MRTANNNITVENLIAKYRNYVDEHCPKLSVYDETEEFLIPDPEKDKAEEQLLITLYTAIAGENADRQIMDALSIYAHQYKELYSSALTEEEFSFLCEHFEEVCSLCFVEIAEHRGGRINLPYSEQTEELVKKYLKPSVGSTIFISELGLCDIAVLFPNCIIKGYTCFCEDKLGWWERELWALELWALAQIRLYSKGITSKILPCQDGCDDKEYLSDVDYVIWGAKALSSFKGADSLYRLLPPQCKMLFFMDDRDSAGSNGDTYDVRMSLVKDNTIDTIVSYESKQEWWETWETMQKRILIVADKSGCEKVHLLDTMRNTSMEIIPDSLDSEILWPSYYMAEKPGNGIPLTDIVTFHEFKTKTELIRGDKDWILPEEMKKMPVAVPAKMAKEYKDANLLSKDLDLAESPIFSDMKKFFITSIREKCVLLYGRKEEIVVGYINELPESGMATLLSVICLIPKEGIDVRYIAALLLTPEVKNQIITICQGDVNWCTFPLIMDKVIVPSHSDKERLAFLSEANYEALNSLRISMKSAFEEKYQAMRSDYINEVRMRKHDMGQMVFDLINTEDLMRYYVENRETESDVWSQIKEQLDHFRSIIHELSEMLNHLSQEERFGAPELLDLNDYLANLQHSNNVNGFTLSYQLDRDSIDRDSLINLQRSLIDEDIKDMTSVKVTPTIYVAKNDLQRVVTNILTNAQKHGFVDSNRKDYEVNIRLEFNAERGMYQIDFRNNGKPLPEGMNKMRYGIKGEKAGQNAGTGLGGSVVKSIVEHYKGDYDVLMDGEWTVIRVYLPIAI